MPIEEPASESRSSSRASSIRSTSSSPKQPTESTQEPFKNDQVPAARPGPISRLISSSARLPSISSSSSSPSTRRQRPDRQSSTTSSSRISFEREGRPPHPRNSSSTTSTRRKPRPQNVAGPTTEQSYNAAGSSGGGGLQNSMFKRMDSTQGGGSAFNGGGGGSTASGASQTGGDEKPLWAMGGVFPTKDRRKSSVAKDWAKSREKERRELKRQEKRSRRKGPERMDSAITEHSSTVGGEGDGGLPSDTIVEQEDPFDRYNGEEARGSGEETDESANAQSDNSGMSRGGSTVGHPVKRQDHEDSANEIESNAVAEESETASELARRRSPGESTLAEQEQKKHDDEYDEKVDRGRDQVEQDSKKGGKTPRSGRNGGEDFDEDSWSVGSGNTGADSDTPQVGGQLNQNKEDWQDDMTPDGPPVRNAWGTIRYALREPMAEFLGTLMLVVLGIGADCQVKISGATAGDYSSQNWTWGFAVMISVYVAGGISGGHTNPAVTISLAIFRGFPWKMVPRYVIAQVLGAFVGALMVYGNYKRAIHDYDPNQLIHAQADPPLNASATLFFTAPATQVGTTPLGFAQEVLAGGILMIAVLALGDENNAPPGAGLGAIVLGFVVVAIGMSNGWVSGYAINPARDLGPRLALWAVGYGTKVWTHDDCWWIFGPLLGPLVGSLGGCLAYDMFIFAGPGSPVNWSAHELAASVGVPQMYHLAKRAAHPKARHKQAQAERDLEATLPTDGRRANIIRRAEFTGQERPGRKGSTERKDLEVVQRWRRGRDKVEKQNDYNRGKYEEARKKSIERQKRQVKERSEAIQSAFAAELENDEVVRRPEESHRRQ